MSFLEKTIFRDPTANRLGGAFMTLQAANTLSLVCRAANIEVDEFHKLVASCFRLYADMVEEPTEQRFSDFATLIVALLKFEEIITAKVIAESDRLDNEEAAHERDELERIAKGGDFSKIFALSQIYHIPCDDMRVEIGGLLRLFSDFVLSGRIDDFEIFCERGIELTKRWQPLIKERAEKTLLGKTGFYKGFPEIKKREPVVKSCANCNMNMFCMVQTGYCDSWKKG